MELWHIGSGAEVLGRLGSEMDRGLSREEAQRRLTAHGPNRLEGKKPLGLGLRVVNQLKDPMILVLLAAAGLSLWVSGGADWMDSLIILVIVVVNALIAITQEDNATKALEALQNMTAPVARVVRGGQLGVIPAQDLVPGDILHLEAGDLIPADVRILTASGLRADESAMTGESVPVEKMVSDRLVQGTPLAERVNLLLSATNLTAGRCVGVVVATGMDSQVGHIAGLLLNQGESETPLQRRMGEISKTLSLVCLGVCAVMFGLGLLQGKGMLDMFLTAVSLAVAAIPEGLPAVVTIVLALGVQRLAGQRAIVKRLPAVETLGCAGVICSDKTGTLTQNKMTVVDTWGRGCSAKEVLTIATLCNDATLAPKALGEPTERALLVAGEKLGLDKTDLEGQFPRVGEYPFDSGRKLMSTLHKSGSGYRLMVKGAPDVLVGRCKLDGLDRQEILRHNETMAGQALRVLGVAYRDFEHHPGEIPAVSAERELTFAGLVGMIDPPRPEVKSAVAACHAAGIRPVMITGDHKLTALTIARELGMLGPGQQAITGADLDFMQQELLETEVERFGVYARVSPEHKMRIVQAWQKRGYVVAMTGDGINDAPALKAADIGCAMGIGGTDVAKGAADLILADDNFATIVSAVEEGRGIYANIKKAVHYLLSCNIGEIITIAAATALGFAQMPLVPVQLLWLNLVTDALPALALGVEPVEEGLMEMPPRGAEDRLFDAAFTFRLAWQGVMVGGLTLGAYLLGYRMAGYPVANTMAFATLTLSQLFHAFDVRSEHHSLFHLGICSNPAMNRAFWVGVALQLSVLCVPPLQLVFSTVALNLTQWVTVLALAITPVVVCEVVKRGKDS